MAGVAHTTGSVSIPSPRRTYGLVATVVIALLVGSLLVPLLFGDPEPSTIVSGGPTGGELGSSAPPTPGDELAPGAGASTTAPPPGTPGTTGLGAPTGTVPAAGPLTASDVGVTADTIKIGVVVLDLEAVGPLGLGIANFEVDTQKRIVQAYFDDINRRGGAHGRTLEPVFVVNDPLDATDAGKARAQCLRLTNDLGVFAVIGFITTASPCVAIEQRTPVVSYVGDLEETYAAAQGYFISIPASTERVAREWADALDTLRLLAGRSVGIFATEGILERHAADALEVRLEANGTGVTHRSRLSADTDTAIAQLPLEVQRMRDAGVDSVLLPTTFASALMFVQAAESQGWAPKYFTSDLGALASEALVRNAGPSFDGAIGVTYTAGGRNPDGSRVPPRPEDEACRTLYNSTTEGRDFAANEEGPLLVVCAIVRVLEAALGGAGPDLTREGFVAAVQRLEQLHLPYLVGGRFGPGRTDYAATVRPVRWGSACTCYTSAGAPIPPRG